MVLTGLGQLARFRQLFSIKRKIYRQHINLNDRRMLFCQLCVVVPALTPGPLHPVRSNSPNWPPCGLCLVMPHLKVVERLLGLREVTGFSCHIQVFVYDDIRQNLHWNWNCSSTTRPLNWEACNSTTASAPMKNTFFCTFSGFFPAPINYVLKFYKLTHHLQQCRCHCLD